MSIDAKSSSLIDLDLVTAMLNGGFESPPWSGFLDQLRDVTGSDFVTLHFHPSGRSIRDSVNLSRGNVLPSAILEISDKYFQSEKTIMGMHLLEGKLYSLDELIDVYDEDNGSFRQFFVDHGIAGIRQMRITEHSGVDAWLTVIRREGDFSREHDRLLSLVGPALRGVLRMYVALERERLVSSLASSAAHRLRFGWLALDAGGQILDGDEAGFRLMEESGVLSKSAGGRLVANSSQIQKEVNRALIRIADKRGSRAYAVTLSREPWLDMLLVPMTNRPISTAISPAVIVYIHGDSWHSADCREQLAELFALTPSESRMALAVCRGMSIAEAAAELKITVGTARSYSKSIYGKTGARGLPDLVRIIMRSVLAIAQESRPGVEN